MSISAAAAAAGIGAGAGTMAGSIGNTMLQAKYDYDAQMRDFAFTREMAQNQMKYNVQQMKDMGYSPMMLFDHGNATGGGAGGGKIGPQPNVNLGILEGINTVGKILAENEKRDLEERKIDLMQDYNDHKFQYLNDKLSNQIKNNNSTLNYQQRNYNYDDLNELYDKF